MYHDLQQSRHSRSVRPVTTPKNRAKHESQPHISPVLQRKGNCSCGGSCPSCQSDLPIQAKLSVSRSGDRDEVEADRVAEQVMRSPEAGSPAMVDAGSRKAGANKHTRLRNELLKSSGQPLPPSQRHYFESRFDADFSDVRIHSDNRAAHVAQSINARAFTLGSDIVFGANEFASNNGSLMAHELTHVLQQRNQPGSQNRVHRQEQPTVEVTQPETVEGWIDLVNQSVRSQFGLSRIRTQLTPVHVNVLNDTAFEQAYLSGLTGSMEERLFEYFSRSGFYSNSRPRQILRHNYVGRAGIRTFVQAGIAANEFIVPDNNIQFTHHDDGEISTRRVELHLTPGQVLAESIAGFTTTESNRARRRVSLRRDFSIPTLTHETIHFYTHPRFNLFANSRSDADERIGQARISRILIEGFTELFTQQTMADNQPAFGPGDAAYPLEVAQARRIFVTVGLPQVIQAYFFGDRAQIRRVGQAIEWYKTGSLDLLVPAFSNLSLPTDSES